MKKPSFLKKVSPGEKVVLEASTWNAFIDSANAHLQSRKIGADPSRDALPTETCIVVRNTTAGTAPRFGVLSLSAQDPLIDPADSLVNFQEAVAMDGTTPAGGGEPFVILLEPLKADGIGRACVAGAVQVQINVSDASHAFAQTEAGRVDRLASTATAAAGTVRILAKQSGTGVKWGIVLLPISHAGGSGASLISSGSDTGLGTGTTTLSWDTPGAPYFDEAGYYAGGDPTKLTAPEDGTYLIEASVPIYLVTPGSGTNYAIAKIRLNGGSANKPDEFFANTTSFVTASFIVHLQPRWQLQLSAGDYVTLEITSNQGAGGTVQLQRNSTDGYPNFSIRKL